MSRRHRALKKNEKKILVCFVPRGPREYKEYNEHLMPKKVRVLSRKKKKSLRKIIK